MTANMQSQEFTIGDKVEINCTKFLKQHSSVFAKWQSGINERTYPGEIMEVNGDGTYKIKFEDGDIRLYCPEEDITARIKGTIEYMNKEDGTYDLILDVGYPPLKSYPPSMITKVISEQKKESPELSQSETNPENKLYSFDAVIALEQGRDEELTGSILKSYSKPHGVRCVLVLGKPPEMKNQLQPSQLGTALITTLNKQYGHNKLSMLSKFFEDQITVSPIKDSDYTRNQLMKNKPVVTILESEELYAVRMSHLTLQEQTQVVGYFKETTFVKEFQTELIDNIKVDDIKVDVNIVRVKERNMTEQELFTERSAEMIYAIRKAGIKHFLFKSPYEERIFCMIGLTEERLKLKAQRERYALQLDPEKAYIEAFTRGLLLGVLTNRSKLGSWAKPNRSNLNDNVCYFDGGFQKGDVLRIVLKGAWKKLDTIRFYNGKGDIVFSFQLKIENNEKSIIRNSFFNGNAGVAEITKIIPEQCPFNESQDTVKIRFKREQTKFEVTINGVHRSYLDFKYRHRDYNLPEANGTIRRLEILPIDGQDYSSFVKKVEILRHGSIFIKDWDVYVSYLRYRKNTKKIYKNELNLYKTYTRPKCTRKCRSIFNDIDRSKLLTAILTEKKGISAQLDMDKLIEDPYSPVSSFYPLHNEEELTKVREKMSSIKWGTGYDNDVQPIRDYFGEQIGFYFAFMGFYTRALIPMAIFGIVVSVWQIKAQSYTIPILPIFAITNTIWASFFMELWKQKQSALSLKWGMEKSIITEAIRPSFTGECRRSPINGEEEEYFSPSAKVRRACMSHSIILVLSTMVIGVISAIFIFRSFLVYTMHWQENIAVYASSVFATIMIKILDVIYVYIAKLLTNWENHRTKTQYYDSLVVKIFLFKSINNYKTIFYTAFIQERDLGCGTNDCMVVLRMHLLGLFVSSILSSMIADIITPKRMRCQVERKLKRGEKKKSFRWKRADRRELQHNNPYTIEGRPDTREAEAQQQYLMSTYEGTLEDFDEVVIRYGFISLFVIVLPIMPALALISQMFETVMDSQSLCTYYRRPMPLSVSNIGAWSDIIDLVGYIAIFTNVAILYNEWEGARSTTKMVMFLLMEHFLLCSKAFISYFMPNDQEDTIIKRKRQEYIDRTLIQEDFGNFDNCQFTSLTRHRAYTGSIIARPDSAVQEVIKKSVKYFDESKFPIARTLDPKCLRNLSISKIIK